jgi:hypothetical protein
MLLFEFCTENNFHFSNNMNGKLSAYKRHLEGIERKFNSHAIVLFVLDISREKVERFVGSVGSPAPSPTACGRLLLAGDSPP